MLRSTHPAPVCGVGVQEASAARRGKGHTRHSNRYAAANTRGIGSVCGYGAVNASLGLIRLWYKGIGPAAFGIRDIFLDIRYFRFRFKW